MIRRSQREIVHPYGEKAKSVGLRLAKSVGLRLGEPLDVSHGINYSYWWLSIAKSWLKSSALIPNAGIHTEGGGGPWDIPLQTSNLPPQTPEEIVEISSNFNLVLCL